MANGWRYSADVGGTFTDVVLIGANNRFYTKKVLSSPPLYETAVVNGLADLLLKAKLPPDRIIQVAHATTVATNAVLQRTGVKTGLITTKGFRDVLELRRIRFPETYNVFWDKPPALVERRLRVEVDERIGSHGEVVTPLDLREASERIRQLVDQEGVAAISVCLINSFANPVHEIAIGELIRVAYPDLPVSLSCEVLPEIKEYERTSTTVLNAYLMPVVSKYLRSLRQRLEAMSVHAPIHVMQSSGGVMSSRAAELQPIFLLESGCAAGIVGAAHLARQLRLASVVTFDMGGTTAKACMIENGEPMQTSEYEVGNPVSVASRLLKGGGDILRVPAVDVAEVGAGGGSIVSVDNAGALHVGPRSAGADPGPVCYQRGGNEPTVTDANLVLGYLNPLALLGGDFPIDSRAAQAAVERIAAIVGSGLLETAYGIHQIANASMARAIRAVSTERGRDLREATLIVYGGNGPAHAVDIAQSLGIPRVIIPLAPGVFSALGLLYSAIERQVVKTLHARLDSALSLRLGETVRELEARLVAELESEGFTNRRIELRRSADLHYRGQWYELRVPVPAGNLDADSAGGIEEGFHAAYERTYGHRQHFEPVELVNLRVIARIGLEVPVLPPIKLTRRSTGTREAYFGKQIGMVDVPLVKRSDLQVKPVDGPLILEEYDSTIVVPPRATASRDSLGNVVLEMKRLHPDIRAE